MPWHIYIIRCKGGLLYTGITNDLDRRIAAHNSGKGCKFTKYRRPVKLLYSESGFTKSGALKREVQIKRLKRSDKLKLIKLERRGREK
ncbi:MAG: GIY-YIG nuclease family protein [Candidatus Omnitrophica bacterium]|nr:GIY-YIG nuclease family protein [Candidatus Omnitrophota bacterium]